MDLERIGSDWYWQDGEELHMNILKLLADFGLDDTEENRELAIDEALEVIRVMLGHAPGYVIRIRPMVTEIPGAPPGRKTPGGGGGPGP